VRCSIEFILHPSYCTNIQYTAKVEISRQRRIREGAIGMNQDTLGESETEPLINHYTDFAGFEGMMRTGELWCTSIRHLNDGSEFHYFMKRAFDMAKFQLSGPEAEAWKFIVDDWPKSEAELETIAVGKIFVASFSAKDDDLSQWRGYGCGPSGVELRFSRTELQKHLAEYSFSLRECIYDQTQQDDYAFWNVMRPAHKEIWFHIAPPEQVSAVFWTRVKDLAPTFKDKTFDAEAESRIVIDLTEPRSTVLPIQFRIRKDKLVPYVALPLPLKALREVRLGPSNEVVDEVTVKLLLAEHSAEHVKRVEKSKIPFR
jgi:hypothetical protein